jgi:hypothetical protein
MANIRTYESLWEESLIDCRNEQALLSAWGQEMPHDRSTAPGVAMKPRAPEDGAGQRCEPCLTTWARIARRGRKQRARAATIAPRHRNAKHDKWGAGRWGRGYEPTSRCLDWRPAIADGK